MVMERQTAGWMFTGQKRYEFRVSSHRTQKMEKKHLIKHESENTPLGELALIFCIELTNGGMVEEEQRIELGCSTCRLNHTGKKIRPQRE